MPTPSPTLKQFTFNDAVTLTALEIQGRLAFVAREIGAALGYARDGKRFVTQIGTNWADEFIEGRDFALFSSAEMLPFNAVYGEGSNQEPFGSRRGMLVLFESGVNLALTKTNKPLGKKLRRWLADEVLPQLVRDGRYDPARRVDDAGRLAVVTPEAADRPRSVEERELAVREFEVKQAKANAILNVVDEFADRFPEGVRFAYKVQVAEMLTGMSLAELYEAGAPGQLRLVDTHPTA